MPRDPYEDAPSLEELEAAGATEWFTDSVAAQKKKNAELRAALGQDTGAVRDRKKELRGLLDLPPGPPLDEEEPAPDFFASERAKAQAEKSALSSLMGDFQARQAAEKDKLKGLLGE